MGIEAGPVGIARMTGGDKFATIAPMTTRSEPPSPGSDRKPDRRVPPSSARHGPVYEVIVELPVDSPRRFRRSADSHHRQREKKLDYRVDRRSWTIRKIDVRDCPRLSSFPKRRRLHPTGAPRKPMPISQDCPGLAMASNGARAASIRPKAKTLAILFSATIQALKALPWFPASVRDIQRLPRRAMVRLHKLDQGLTRADRTPSPRAPRPAPSPRRCVRAVALPRPSSEPCSALTIAVPTTTASAEAAIACGVGGRVDAEADGDRQVGLRLEPRHGGRHGIVGRRRGAGDAGDRHVIEKARRVREHRRQARGIGRRRGEADEIEPGGAGGKAEFGIFLRAAGRRRSARRRPPPWHRRGSGRPRGCRSGCNSPSG